MRHFLTITAVLALSGPAVACINDTELINHEREFRSQYRESQYRPPEPQQVSSARPYLMGGSGLLLGLVGVGAMFGLRSRG
jgi:hypothetical protein